MFKPIWHKKPSSAQWVSKHSRIEEILPVAHMVIRFYTHPSPPSANSTCLASVVCKKWVCVCIDGRCWKCGHVQAGKPTPRTSEQIPVVSLFTFCCHHQITRTCNKTKDEKMLGLVFRIFMGKQIYFNYTHAAVVYLQYYPFIYWFIYFELLFKWFNPFTVVFVKVE